MGLEYFVSQSYHTDNTLAGIGQTPSWGVVGFVQLLGNDEGLVNWDVHVGNRLSPTSLALPNP